MIQATNDVQTLQHFVENWERVIIEYFKKNKDNMAARNIVAQRNVGAQTSIDEVQHYDRTEDWTEQAGLYAKGTVPKITGINARSTPWPMFQNGTSFNLHQKDITQDPKAKSRLADIAAKNIHRKEDRFVLEGDPNLSINGIADMGAANSLGKIVASGATGNDINNKGAWTGETSTDIFDDLLNARNKLGPNFDGSYLVGTKSDLTNCFRKDSERNSYTESIGPLFGKTSKDLSWMFMNDNFSSSVANKVYVVAKDPDGSEFVISENPKLLSYGMQPGQVFYFELFEWISFEAHDNQSVVEVAIN